MNGFHDLKAEKKAGNKFNRLSSWGTAKLLILISYSINNLKHTKMIYKNNQYSEESLNEFLKLINAEPENVETNDDGYKHIPIAFIEADLRRIYQGLVQYEITQTIALFNSVSMNVRLKVFHPVLQEWLNYDGSAAVLIESVTQGKYADTQKVVKANDENMAVAMVYSEAIKKAAQRIGERFGSNLNRENAPGKSKSTYDEMPPVNIEELIESKPTKSELLQLMAAGRLTLEQKVFIDASLKTGKEKKTNGTV